MKKTMSRILTLVLVLAMLVGVVPMALAAGTVNSVTLDDLTLTLTGEGDQKTATTTLSAKTTCADGYSVTVTYSGEGVTGSTFTATTAKTYTVTATATFSKEGSDNIVLDDTATITVNEETPAPEPTVVTPSLSGDGSTTIPVGGSTSKSVTYNPNVQGVTVSWSSGNTEVATVNASSGLVTGEGVGTATITATLTAPTDADFTLTTTSLSYNVTVEESDYTITSSPRSISLIVGGESAAVPTVTVKKDGETVETATVSAWTSKDPAVAKVEDSKVVPVAMGSTSISATVTVGEESHTVSCAVSVSADGTISCSGGSAKVGSTISLKPTLVSEEDYNDVEFSFERKSGKASVNSSTGAVTSSSVGVSTITITATFDDGKQTATKDVQVSFYDSTDIEVTLEDNVSKFSFDEDDVFSDVEVDGVSKSTKQSLESLMLSGTGSDGKWVDITVSSSSESAGKLTLAGGNISHMSELSLGNVVFTPSAKGNGKFVFSYTIEADDDLVLLSGYVTIYCDYSGDISYETDAGTKVTFDEDDFEDFWDDNGSGTLSYITFTVSSRNYGTLYTSSSEKTKVTSSMKFEANYKSSSKNYDLDTVTYVPDEDRTSTYTDTYEFTAYNTKGDEYYGSVIITVGGGSSTTITSRGVVFGTAELTELLEDTFKEEKGATLNYVTFTLPDADEGKLFYDFSDMLSSTLVKSTDKFYVDPARTEKDLDDVAFVPAAGTYGKVTLRYKAYGASDSVSYSGTLTLTVTEKTKSAKFSDVTSTSYSWAADSVDFLYYEGIAQGSSGKYNPATNITRGDFMLMLYRAFLEDEYEDYNVTSNFPDVVKGSDSYSKETYQAVGVAKHLGIAQGTNGKYNPKAYITREEAMTLIYRTLDEVDYSMSYESSNDTSDFKDYSSVASYAKTAISDLIEHGVVVGNNGKINPKSNITRAEMAVILHRVLTY